MPMIYGNGGSSMLPPVVAALLPTLLYKICTNDRATLLLPEKCLCSNRFDSLPKGRFRKPTEHRDERTRLGTVHPRHRRGDSRERDFNIKIEGLRYQNNTRDNPRFRGYQPYNNESN